MADLIWYQPFIPYTTQYTKKSKEFYDLILTNSRSTTEFVPWLDQYIHDWCLVNKFLISLPNKNTMGKQIDNTYTYAPNITEDDIGIVDAVFTKNFRTLTSPKSCQEFVEYLRDTQADFTFNSFLQLHITITSRADAMVLSTHMTKLYMSLQQYSDMADNATDTTLLTWANIHAAYPFMWLLYEVQQYMHRYKNITK